MTYFLFETRKKIGFDQVVATISPKSPYGKDRQDQVSPLNAADLKAEFARLGYTLKAAGSMKPRRLTELKTLFSRLPVIEESLDMLEAGAAPPMPFMTFDKVDGHYKGRRDRFYTETIRRHLFIQPYHHWYIAHRHTAEDLDTALTAIAESLQVVSKEY